MSDVIKFTEQEMQSIAKLQNDYQQHIFTLGQVDLEKTDLELMRNLTYLILVMVLVQPKYMMILFLK